MNFIKTLRGAASALAIAGTLAGCATTPGPLNGMSSDVMAMIILSDSRGPISSEGYIIAALAANGCGEFVKVQISGPFEAALTEAAVYGITYAAGNAVQGPVYGTDPVSSATVGGAIGVAGGIANGLNSYSFARSNVMGNCTEVTLRDWARGDAPQALKDRFPNMAESIKTLHAYASYVRTRNRTDRPAPRLVGDWSGPRAGEPVRPH